MIDTFTDVEGAVKSWLLSAPSVTGAVGQAGGRPFVFIGQPTGNPVPSLVLYRAGGSPRAGDIPIDQARISFNCWGRTRAQAVVVALALVSLARSIHGSGVMLDASTRCLSTDVVLWQFFPDPILSQPRFIVDIVFDVISSD